MSFNNSDYDSSNVEIEEFEVDEVDVSDLTEFIELGGEALAKLPVARGGPSTSTVKARCTTASESDTDDERMQQRETLLKKLVAREITYSEYQERLPDDELDEEDGYLELAKQRKRANYENDYATARMDAFRGNLQGSSPTENKRRRRKNLPPALQGLMGEANLCFARGDMKTAKDLCLEIIRQVPLAHEPFITLAQIYETDDPEQYLHYSLIAAHLNPTDVGQWTQVAELCVERGKVDLALTCYTRALKTDPKNVEIRLKRAQLAESRGDAKQAYRYYYGMLPYIPQEQGDLMISTAKKVAKKFHEETNIGAALDAMQIAYSTVPDKFSTEDINVLLELMIANGLYRRALDILSMHAGVEVVETGSDVVSREEPKPMVMITISDDIMLDFRTKLAVVVVHLKYEHLFEHLIEDIVMYIDPESDGDCYLDIAEALMKEHYYRFALRMLEPLIRSKKFSLAAVWLRYADCCRHVEANEEAIAAYRKVVSLAQHLDARLALAALLKKRGDHDEALEALKQDPDVEYLDPEVLYERCLLLEEVGHYQEFLAEGFMLLARHCYELKNRYEMDTVVLGFRMYTSRLGDLKNRSIGEGAPAFSTSNDLSLETEWDLVLRLVKAADILRDYTFFMKLVFTLRTSKRFERYRNELQQLALTACIYNRDPTFGLNIIRDQIRAIVAGTKLAKLNQSHLWNLFNLVILISGDARYQRYLSRLFKRVPGIGIYPKTLLANYHLNSTTYKYALNEYNKIYNKTKDPLIAMLIAVTLLQIASQKYSTKKHSLLAQANVYMEKYRQGRPDELQHEVWYNYGRLYHQLGIYHLATDYYKRVLHFDSEVVRENPQHLCLKAEAAYNLCSIYKQSGNLMLARKYMYDYLQV